jgi:hypothetical protein
LLLQPVQEEESNFSNNLGAGNSFKPMYVLENCHFLVLFFPSECQFLHQKHTPPLPTHASDHSSGNCAAGAAASSIPMAEAVTLEELAGAGASDGAGGAGGAGAGAGADAAKPNMDPAGAKAGATMAMLTVAAGV